MAYNYVIRYSYEDKTREWRAQAISPVSALNQFHSDIQLTRDVALDRRTETRPKLKPHQYAIIEMAQIYTDGKGYGTESLYDLPKVPNPDLAKVKQPKVDQDAFGFLASTPVKEVNA